MPATSKLSSAQRARLRPPRKRKNQSTSRKKGHSGLEWIRELASPYLKGYAATAASADGLEGYWFKAEHAPATSPKRKPAPRASAETRNVGFFVGYLNEASAKYSFLKPEPPECVVFAWISSADGELHKRLVREPGSLVRRTFDYIRWLTHRPPRFVFHEKEEAAMARHASMKDWPAAKREHLSRNFFIETLCWLVRSGLVRKLREGPDPSNVLTDSGDAGH